MSWLRQRIRFDRNELSGAFGDIGTDFPLLVGMILAAGLDGVDRKIEPGDPINENLYEWSPQQLKEAGINVLPQSLAEALDEFATDTVLREAIGEELSQEFLRLKRMEWIEYCRHVSDWERQRYLEFF